MRIWLIAAGTALLGGCGEGNVYDMPVADAYAKLANLRVEPSGTGPSRAMPTWVARSESAL